MLTFAMATAGNTVFGPSPVKPESSPLTSNVGRPHTRSSTEYPDSPASFGAPHSLRYCFSSNGSFFHSARSASVKSRTSS